MNRHHRQFALDTVEIPIEPCAKSEQSLGAVASVPSDNSIERVVRMVSGKWKVSILSRLSSKPMRYGELVRSLPNVSTKVITDQLRSLERSGLVIRHLSGSHHFEYAMTHAGSILWNGLASWARAVGQPVIHASSAS